MIIHFVVIFMSLSCTKAGELYLDFNDDFFAENGLASPSLLHVIENQMTEIRLLKTVNDQKKCLLTTPNLETVDMNSPQNPKFSKGSSACSVKINSVTMDDIGIWKLQSINDGTVLQGISSLYVESPANHSDSTITLMDSSVNTLIKFFDESTSYCSLYRENTKENIFIRGDCELPIDKVSKNLNGEWKVTVGLPNQVDESVVHKSVKVQDEILETGLVENANDKSASLYCNLKYSLKNVTFCRFERVNDKMGFNLIDGLGSSNYQYYGKGLYYKECGIHIQSLKAEDYGMWKCQLGLQVSENKTTEMINFIQLKQRSIKTARSSNSDDSTVTYLAVKNQVINLKYQVSSSLIYCRFRHPNGTELYPRPKSETGSYWYDEDQLMSGECSFHLNEINEEDAGTWVVSMGHVQPGGLESIGYVTVRVTGPLAALDQNIKAKRGDLATLRCQTSGSRQALKYCRFALPDKTGFTINEMIHGDNPLLGEYYFPQDRSLLVGDCAVTIKSITDKHLGTWTCAAMIDGQHEENVDYIQLETIDPTLSAASVTGIALGALIVCAALISITYRTWNKRQTGHSSLETGPSTARTTVAGPEPSVHFRPSGESDTSTTELTFSPEIRGTALYGSSSSPSSQT